MVLEEKTPGLLALLIAHVRGASPAIPMVARPPTLAPMVASFGDNTNKKRKRAKGAKDLRMLKRGRSFTLHSSP